MFINSEVHILNGLVDVSLMFIFILNLFNNLTFKEC